MVTPVRLVTSKAKLFPLTVMVNPAPSIVILFAPTMRAVPADVASRSAVSVKSAVMISPGLTAIKVAGAT